VPTEVVPEVDAALPDLPSPELRQDGAEPVGGEQVGTPDAAPTDGTVRAYLPATGYRGPGTMC
jgi:hypothetical protein